MGYQSSHQPRGYETVHTVTGPTEKDVQDGIDALMGRYHPMGYGTKVSSPPRQRDDGTWTAEVTRDSSAG